jgi:transcriptional regulator with XRE-family HTH domain
MTAEEVLARRIAHERAARGWSYQRMADAMSEVGCPIAASALFKIEKGTPRRRVTVDELAAIADLWAIPMDRLVRE